MPNSSGDTSFDASALFRELIDDPEDENDWVFFFSHADVERLQSGMEEIMEAFAAEVDIDVNEPIGSFDEAPITIAEDGVRTTGPPMITIEYSGVITESKLGRLHKLFKKLTKKCGIDYGGVEIY